MKFDKYFYYSESVQSPEADCDFISDTYKELRGRRPFIFREDFCAGFLNCCTWVKKSNRHKAIGIDLDPEPVEYGKKNYLTKLSLDQQSRILIALDNVLTAKVPKADVIAAMNFSYFLFKSRMMLRQYFTRARKGLKPDGIFITDAFGGGDCQEGNIEHTKHKNFTYFWEQRGFNPISSEAIFDIHFKIKGEKRPRKRVFTYDWRLWTLREIRETMLEAGFKRTHVYWEGTTKKGTGNGIFKRTEQGEECDGWIAYVVGEA